MGCNCKVTKKILDIHRKYGTPVQVSAIDKIKYYIEEFPKLLSIIVLGIIFSPILLIVFIVIIIQQNGAINITKLINRYIKR